MDSELSLSYLGLHFSGPHFLASNGYVKTYLVGLLQELHEIFYGRNLAQGLDIGRSHIEKYEYIVLLLLISLLYNIIIFHSQFSDL